MCMCGCGGAFRVRAIAARVNLHALLLLNAAVEHTRQSYLLPCGCVITTDHALATPAPKPYRPMMNPDQS